MIINFIIHMILTPINLIFDVLPDLPSMSSTITTALAWVTTTIADTVSVIRMVLGGTLLDAVIVVVVLAFSFEYVYKVIMWVLKKIPVLNMK